MLGWSWTDSRMKAQGIALNEICLKKKQDFFLTYYSEYEQSCTISTKMQNQYTAGITAVQIGTTLKGINLIKITTQSSSRSTTNKRTWQLVPSTTM